MMKLQLQQKDQNLADYCFLQPDDQTNDNALLN